MVLGMNDTFTINRVSGRELSRDDVYQKEPAYYSKGISSGVLQIDFLSEK